MDSPTSASTYKPLPRQLHVSVRVGEMTYMWGGRGEDGSPLPATVLEVFQGHWNPQPTTGTPPRAVVGSAAAAIGSTLYHYGGLDGEGGRSNSLHGLEVGEKAWREVDVVNPGGAPIPAAGCGMVTRGEELVVFAGQTATGRTNDLKVFHSGKGTWSTPMVSGTPPPPLAYFSFDLYDQNHAVLYGGRTEGGGESEDVYILDVLHWHWTKVGASTGPGKRSFHATCLLTGPLTNSPGSPILLVVGGYPTKKAKVLDLATHVWSKVDLPPGVVDRWSHTATIAWAGEKQVMVVVHGGVRSRTIADTTIIQFAVDSTRTTTPGAPPRLQLLQVVASEWDPTSNRLYRPNWKEADMGRWKEMADMLQNLAKLQIILKTRKTIPIKAVSIVLFGVPRAGKSTLIQRITNPSFVITRGATEMPSTALANQPLPVLIKKPSAAMATLQQSQVVRQSFQDEKLYLSRHAWRAVSQIPSSDHGQREQPCIDRTPVPQPAAVRDATNTSQSNHWWRFFRRKPKQSSPQTPTSPPGPTDPPSEPTDPPPGATAQDEPPPSFQSADDIIAEALQGATLGGFIDEDEQCTLLHVLDTGGQPELSEVVSRLLSGSAIYLLVFRLCDSLTKRFLVKHLSVAGEQMDPYLSSFTVEEVVFQALSSISHMAPPPTLLESPHSPTLTAQSATLLVGTHRDLVSGDAVESIDDTLQRKMRESSIPNNKIIHYPNPDWKEDHTKPSHKLVIPIDNTSPSDPGLPLLTELISDVLEEHFKTTDVPVSWLLFLQSLRSTGARVLSFRQCATIAGKCGIESDDEVRLALWYLSQQFGTIRYYAHVKGMEGTVIIDVQILFDGSTCLISTSFRRGKACTDLEKRFQRTGRCPIAEAEKLLQCEGDIPPAQLLQLFEHLRLLTPVEDEDGKVTEYFVPTVLPSCDVETLPQPTDPAPLLFTFSTGFCPTGLFHALMVHLSSPRLQSELKWRLYEDELFRNKIYFYVGDDFDKVTIISRPTFYEVWVERRPRQTHRLPLPRVCSIIRSIVYEGIAAVKLSPTSSLAIAHHTAFYCQIEGCHSASHPAVPEAAHAVFAVCSFTGQPSPLTPEQSIWFGETPQPTTTSTDGRAQAILQTAPTLHELRYQREELPEGGGSQVTQERKTALHPGQPKPTTSSTDGRAQAILQMEPILHELRYLEYQDDSGRSGVRVIEGLSSRWEALADCLKFRSGVIGGIKKNNPCDCDTACREILNLWLRGDRETRQPVTWATLIQTIREIDSKFDPLADKLTHALLFSKSQPN